MTQSRYVRYSEFVESWATRVFDLTASIPVLKSQAIADVDGGDDRLELHGPWITTRINHAHSHKLDDCQLWPGIKATTIPDMVDSKFHTLTAR